MSAPAIRIEGLSKRYGSGDAAVDALRKVDMSIEPGEVVGLIGPSGSGKSTLLNLVGLLDRPTAGRIVLGGVDTAGLDERGLTALRARMLGFVFQFHHLLPAFTALENVMMPLMVDAGRPDAAMRARALELLDAVGVAKFMDRPAGNLSGGQQQRVAIARALARKPPLVLADEPTGNLDTASSTQAFELMRRLNRDDGAAFLIVTHDVRIAQRCDRIIEMVDGKVVKDAAS